MKKVFVIPYFGKLPNYIQLWLDSCARNPDFQWLLITDCSIVNLIIPNNVIVKKATLADIKQIFQKAFEANICLNNAYKLCDYRPIYWLILDYYKIQYDFWGYCDMDLIFGKLNNFLPNKLFEQYDRIYSNGHLSLMSASIISKYAFMLDGSERPWNTVFLENENFGFDEQHGVNKIWKNNSLLYYESITDIADIDPAYCKFYLTYFPYNKKNQFFLVHNGKVLQAYSDIRNNIHYKEFAYIHFQKRKMNINNKISKFDTFLIANTGFTRLPELPKEQEDVIPYMQQCKTFSLPYLFKRMRTMLRFYKNRLLDVI